MNNNKKSSGYLKWFRLASIVMPIIGFISIIFPSLLRYIANKALQKIQGLKGHIDKIEFSFFHSSIHVNGLNITVLDPSKNEWISLFASRTIEIDFKRASLWNGIIEINVFVDSPSVILKKGIDINISSSNVDVPFILNGCRIANGDLFYVDESVSPHLTLKASKIEVSGEQIIQQEGSTMLTFVAQVAATIYGGHLSATVKTDLQSPELVFDLNAEIKGVDLPALNDFFEAYGHFTVNKGTFEVFSEVAAADGKFKGYVKPFVEELEFIGPKDKNESVIEILWEALLGTINEIFKNHSKDELATKVPIYGTFKNTKVNVWVAVLETLKNGFVSALCIGLDHEINITSVKKS